MAEKRDDNMMFVEKLTEKMLKEEYPNSKVVFNGSESPDFTISHKNGIKRYVEVKTIHHSNGVLRLRCEQFERIKYLPNAWLWVFDNYSKLIMKAYMGIITPEVTGHLNGLKIKWYRKHKRKTL